MKLGTGFVLVAVTHQHRAIILMSAGAKTKQEGKRDELR
jgi:hypothetical protein